MSNALIDLVSNRVLAEEIDQLGHLSVPFYEARAQAASRALATKLGCDLEAEADRGVEFTLVDAYLRNLREQFFDAPLVVRGGVLSASDKRLRFYQELINTETDVLAATFIHEFEMRDQDSGTTDSFSTEVVQRGAGMCIDIPEHGKPRSLDVDQPPHVLNLEQARALSLPVTAPRRIEAEECDENGVYLREHFASLPYVGYDDDELSMQWVFETSDGRQLGIADLESRSVLFDLPSAGDEIQVFSANVAMAEKVLKRSHWVFNVSNQALISISTVVSLPLDLQARQSAPIPEEMRQAMESQFHPELA